MHPAHIETAAQFALNVANGWSLTTQVIRGARIDDTGASGSIQQFGGGGAVNPAYTARQTLLQTETLPFYRAQAGTTAAPAARPVYRPNVGPLTPPWAVPPP
jgi:hypothetical protein